MANTCTNTRRSQCKGIRSGPQFGLWMWCVVIISLISLPCIVSRCLGVEISVALYPGHSINLRYGEPLELLCIAENGTAENLEFQLGGKPMESTIVNRTTRRLYRDDLKKDVYNFYCRHNITKNKCTNRVLVDDPPSNVTDFNCISFNLERLKCTWNSPPTHSKTNYTIKFISNNVATVPTECLKDEQNKNYFCEWNETSMPRYQQQDDAFNMQLKSCNVFGCNFQNFDINHWAIVKPVPPSGLKVLKNNSHSVLLQWNVHANLQMLADHCTLVHRIEYQIAKIDNTSYFRSVDTSSLVNVRNITYRFWLTDLPYAHMQYEVRIFLKTCFATEKMYWSDFKYVMFTTASEKPQRPPDTIVGAFAQSIYEDKRVIYVYWKQLEEYEESGANFTYRVVAYQGSRHQQTIYPDQNKSLSYIILDNASLEAINIYVWSSNAVGESTNSSHLYIPSKVDTQSLRVVSFTKLAYEDGTYKLSWLATENIDNYTLFWCQLNATQVCAGRMNFTTLEPNKNIHVIDLPKENRYQFAISANQGFKTSGMIWASCDISKDAIAMYGFPVKLDHDAPGKSFVKITWTMSCTLAEGVITGYQITYCPVLDTSNVCDNTTTKNQSTVYIDNPKQMEKNITDLKPYRTYLFTLSMNTIYGLKKIENASTRVTTTEDTPENPRDVKISHITYDSFITSWIPPLNKNGRIGKYVIMTNGREKLKEIEEPDPDRALWNITVDRLRPFTNYTISVIACNTAISSCSKPIPSDTKFVRTRIGPPSTLLEPIIETNPDLLKWRPPLYPGGTVDSYEILRIKDNNNNTAETFRTRDLMYNLTYCEGVDVSESYQVRAVNYDEDPYHGALLLGNDDSTLPEKHTSGILEFPGEWSNPKVVRCKSTDGKAMILILLVVCTLIAVMYGSIKLIKKVRKMEDIKPVLPNGLGIPEKDNSKYAYGGLYSINKDDKPSSDEMLLLPNSRTTVSTPENKENTENNCGSSDHTDSTALSETSRGPTERRASSFDDGSDASLHLEAEPIRNDDKKSMHGEEESSNSETEHSPEHSPCFSDKAFKKNPSGYVQPVVNANTGYVQSAPAPPKNVLGNSATQPASSNYVMAALSPPIFTTGVAPPVIPSQLPASSGYVRPEDAQARSMMNFPKLGPSPTKVFGSESLPTMPTLPQPVSQKHGADSSYIQLQSLDALTSHKQPVRSAVPLKTPASSGYVSPGDAVINKHLNNMLSGGQLAEESAILDPTMSPDAYCRFSWSTDPANDNLNTLLADSHTLKSSKN